MREEENDSLQFSNEVLDDLEKERDKKRMANKIHRLTFDCYNAILKDGRVTCQKEYPLTSTTYDGSLTGVSVLRGRSASRCYDCPDFSGD